MRLPCYDHFGLPFPSKRHYPWFEMADKTAEDTSFQIPPTRASSDRTVVEPRVSGGSSPDMTVIEDRLHADGRRIAPDSREFRGWQLAGPFPARGSKADIFLLEKDGANRVLKLYRLD